MSTIYKILSKFGFKFINTDLVNDSLKRPFGGHSKLIRDYPQPQAQEPFFFHLAILMQDKIISGKVALEQIVGFAAQVVPV